mgnify:FL=1
MTKAVASFLLATASLLGGLAVPVAFPSAPQWVGFLGIGLALLFLVVGLLLRHGADQVDRGGPLIDVGEVDELNARGNKFPSGRGFIRSDRAGRITLKENDFDQ